MANDEFHFLQAAVVQDLQAQGPRLYQDAAVHCSEGGPRGLAQEHRQERHPQGEGQGQVPDQRPQADDRVQRDQEPVQLRACGAPAPRPGGWNPRGQGHQQQAQDPGGRGQEGPGRHQGSLAFLQYLLSSLLEPTIISRYKEKTKKFKR